MDRCHSWLLTSKEPVMTRLSWRRRWRLLLSVVAFMDVRFFSTKRSVGFFWLNAAETWIDIASTVADKVSHCCRWLLIVDVVDVVVVMKLIVYLIDWVKLAMCRWDWAIFSACHHPRYIHSLNNFESMLLLLWPSSFSINLCRTCFQNWWTSWRETKRFRSSTPTGSRRVESSTVSSCWVRNPPTSSGSTPPSQEPLGCLLWVPSFVYGRQRLRTLSWLCRRWSSACGRMRFEDWCFWFDRPLVFSYF